MLSRRFRTGSPRPLLTFAPSQCIPRYRLPQLCNLGGMSMNIQRKNSAHHFRMQSEREQTLGNTQLALNRRASETKLNDPLIGYYFKLFLPSTLLFFCISNSFCLTYLSCSLHFFYGVCEILQSAVLVSARVKCAVRRTFKVIRSHRITIHIYIHIYIMDFH